MRGRYRNPIRLGVDVVEVGRLVEHPYRLGGEVTREPLGVGLSLVCSSTGATNGWVCAVLNSVGHVRGSA